MCFARYLITHTGVSNTMCLKQLSFKERLISLGSVLLALGHKQARYRLEKSSCSPLTSQWHEAAVWPKAQSDRDFLLLRTLWSRIVPPSQTPLRGGTLSQPNSLGLFGDSKQYWHTQMNPTCLGPFRDVFNSVSPMKWLFCRHRKACALMHKTLGSPKSRY